MSAKLTVLGKLCVALLPPYAAALQEISNANGTLAFYGISGTIRRQQRLLLYSFVFACLLGLTLGPFHFVSIVVYAWIMILLRALYGSIKAFSQYYDGWVKQYGALWPCHTTNYSPPSAATVG